jgi:DNA replication protein DnaC
MMGRAAIPPRFVNRSLRNYTADTDGQKRALSVCQRYAATFTKDGGAKENGTCLILAGNPGTGKTHLAAGVANYLLENGSTAVYSTAMTAIRAIRETWQNKTGKTESQVIQDFVKPDLLILDEIGVQHGTEAEKLHLFDLINARYEAVKPTLIISNLELDAVEQFIGERAFDRLREGGGKAVSFDWGSSRKRAAS